MNEAATAALVHFLFFLFCNTSSFQKGITIGTVFAEVYNCSLRLFVLFDWVFYFRTFCKCDEKPVSYWEDAAREPSIFHVVSIIKENFKLTGPECSNLCWSADEDVLSSLFVDSKKSSAGSSFQNSKNGRICIQFPFFTQFSETRHQYFI